MPRSPHEFTRECLATKVARKRSDALRPCAPGGALRRAVLPERRTGTALGHLQLTLDAIDALTPARGA